MMHSNGFVLAVKDANRRVLREIGGRVYLPFDSEYSILLKNNNTVRSCCSVFIDGTDVLGGRELILESHDSIDLERFMVDGDLSSGQRFKFVPLADGQVADPSNPENGIIEVKFWREYTPPSPRIVEHHHYYSYTYPDPYYPKITWTSSGTTGGVKGMSVGTQGNVVSPDSMMFCSNTTGDAENCFCVNTVSNGATVEGSRSAQAFSTGSFGFKEGFAPTIIRLMIVGSVKPVTVKETRKKGCTVCSKRAGFNDKFCSACGAKLETEKVLVNS